MQRDLVLPARGRELVDGVGEDRAVDHDGVAGGGELDRRRDHGSADRVVLLRRFRQPRIDPAADDGEQEVVDAEVHAPLERCRHGAAHRRLPDARRAGDDEQSVHGVAQSNLSAEYFISFCHLWVASMVRMVPDFERITIDCVLAPLPQ